MEKRRKDERAEIRPGRFRRFQSRLNACPIILLRHKKNANKKLPKKNMNLAPKKCFLFFTKKNFIKISFWSRRLLMGHIPPPIDSIVLRRRHRSQCKCCHSPSGLGDAAHEWRTRVLIFRKYSPFRQQHGRGRRGYKADKNWSCCPSSLGLTARAISWYFLIYTQGHSYSDSM